MSLKDEFKKFIHPYDDEDEPVEYQEDDYQDRPRRDDRREAVSYTHLTLPTILRV